MAPLLLENTVLGGLLILLTALMRWAFRGRLNPNVTLICWAVCLGRLLTPFRWRSGLSLYVPPEYNRGIIPANPSYSAAAPGQTQGPVFVLAAYLLVAAVLGALCLISWRSTRRRVWNVRKVGRDDRRYPLLPRGTTLREGNMRGAPLTFGVTRPQVVVTPGLGEAEERFVLTHEGVHAMRRDNLWHYVMTAALLVHWFNPLVWLMAGLLRRDVELSCDRAALKLLGADQRAAYAYALINLSVRERRPLFIHCFSPKRTVEERIHAVMDGKRTTALSLLAALLLFLGTVTLATSPAKADMPDVDGDVESPVEDTQEQEKPELPSGGHRSTVCILEPTGELIDGRTNEIVPGVRIDMDAFMEALEAALQRFRELAETEPGEEPPETSLI